MRLRIIFILFSICLWCFIAVKGSCLEYGHSCWGAHGKRSRNGLNVNDKRNYLIEKMFAKHLTDNKQIMARRYGFPLGKVSYSTSIPSFNASAARELDDNKKELLLKNFFVNEMNAFLKERWHHLFSKYPFSFLIQKEDKTIGKFE